MTHGVNGSLSKATLAYDAMAGAIQARHLQTDLTEAVWVDVDESSGDAREKLRREGFDQAPARRDGQLIGYVITEELVSTYGEPPLVHPLDASVVVSAHASVLDVMEGFLDQLSLVFVVDRHEVTGFITPSDLNKHPARAHFYLLLADLEMALAQLVRAKYLDQEAAVRLVNDRLEQNKIRRRYRKDRLNGVDVDLVTGMDLSHLLQIVGATEGLRRTFGAPDLETWNAWTSALPELRNSVMHAVIEFLKRDRTVSDLVDLEYRIRIMLSRLQSNPKE